MRFIPPKGYVAHYVIYTDDWFLEDSIEATIDYVDKILIARTLTPWNGQKRDLGQIEALLDELLLKYGDRLEVYEANFENEQQQRNFLLEKSREEGYRGAFIIDADEIFLPEAFRLFYKYISAQNPAAIRSSYYTFIKDASFTVAPPYETNLFYVSLEQNVLFDWARKINTSPLVLLSDDPAILHFSYLRKRDEDILRKIENFMHHGDADWEKWYNEVYLKFNKNLKNFHPVEPQAWAGVELFDVQRFPDKLRKKLAEHGKLFYYERVLQNPDLKLHLGCGDKILKDYINIDLYNPHADLNLDITDLSYFDDNSVSEIFMNAVFENLYTFQQIPFLLECKRVLKPQGMLRMDSIPDFDVYIKAYLEGAPGNFYEVFDLNEVFRYTHGMYTEENKLGQIHKDIFTKEKVRSLLTKVGFEIKSLKNVHWGDEPIPCNINVEAVKPDKSEDALAQAERLLNEGNLEEGKKILDELLQDNPNNPKALNDLAVIHIQQNQTEQGKSLLERAFYANPEDEAVLNNLFFLYRNNALSFDVNWVKKPEDFTAFYLQHQPEFKCLQKLRAQISSREQTAVKGICRVCNDLVPFENKVQQGEANKGNVDLICPNCRLNMRQRAALHYLLDYVPLNKETRFYLTENDSALYGILKDNFTHVVAGQDFSTTNSDSLPNTPESAGFDIVLSFDAMSRVGNYRNKLEEFFKLLKSKATLLLSVPFDAYYSRTVSENGNNHFGWDLLSELHEAGFKDASVIFFRSPVFGYYNVDTLIVAQKNV